MIVQKILEHIINNSRPCAVCHVSISHDQYLEMITPNSYRCNVTFHSIECSYSVNPASASCCWLRHLQHRALYPSALAHRHLQTEG